jgi:transcription antitermination factor NusG
MQNERAIWHGEEEVRSAIADPSWCAVRTRYQHEGSVDTLLNIKGFETFLPVYTKIHRWKDRRKPVSRALFPGYLFVANAHDDKLRVVETPGVCDVVSVAGIPAIIPGHEIAAIRMAVGNPLAVEPHDYLRDGDRVRVTRGPLEGLEGILVRKKGSLRLVVSLELLGRAAAVEIDGSCIQVVKPQIIAPTSMAESPVQLRPA